MSEQRLYRKKNPRDPTKLLPNWYVSLCRADGKRVSVSTKCRDREAAEATATKLERAACGVGTVPVVEIRSEATAAAYVYFVEGPGGAIKIGCTKDLGVRVVRLQTSSPEKLRLLAAVPGGRQLERALHDAFAGERGEGEWFRGTIRLRALIDELAGLFPADGSPTRPPLTRGGRARERAKR